MKSAVSNIAWAAEQDLMVYDWMREYGFEGLEIAPTRVLQNPYDHLVEAKQWSSNLLMKYGFKVPSMQSIWYGRQERLFGSDGERELLLSYTKKAIDFAHAIGCKNLVFGCPRNRAYDSLENLSVAVSFFKQLGDYAASKGTVLAMEANPTIYNTNYINDTRSALQLIKQVNSEGFLLNLDVGTMIQNEEDVSELKGQVRHINHVHISEPGLKPIKERNQHVQLIELLKQEKYDGYVSLEMGKQDEIEVLKHSIEYVARITKQYLGGLKRDI